MCKRRFRLWLPGAALLAAGLGLIVLGLAPAGAQPTMVAGTPDLVRFHVFAHSDRPEDQALKLGVRDALLPALAAATANGADTDRTLAALEAAVPDLELRAAAVVQLWGAYYPVRIVLAPTHFEARVYDEMTIPAGTYESLLVIIGDGAGQNWWCVLFPSLCARSGTSRVEVAGKRPVTAAPAAPGAQTQGTGNARLATNARILVERKAEELPVVPTSAFARWWRQLFGAKA